MLNRSAQLAVLVASAMDAAHNEFPRAMSPGSGAIASAVGGGNTASGMPDQFPSSEGASGSSAWYM